MPDINPYTENPYAAPEEPKAVFPHDGWGGEPVLPLMMSLSHKAGGFASRPCELSVTADRMVISAGHLAEPVTIFRETARQQVKLRLLDMIVRGDDGKKYRLVYPKDDRNKSLTLARLETWMDPHLTNDSEASGRRVVDRLKKWSAGMVHNWLTGLLVLQVVVMLMLVIFFRDPFMNTQDIVHGLLAAVGVLAILNAILLSLLHFRQMWVLYLVIVLYSLACLNSILGKNVIGVLISGVMVYQSVKALSEYGRLRSHIRV